MRFLKILGLLFFLVFNSLVFAFTIYEEIHIQKDSAFSHQFNEELRNIGESILTVPSSLPALPPISLLRTPDYALRGSTLTRQANEYIRYSATISPGLYIQKIIFPFHTFL